LELSSNLVALRSIAEVLRDRLVTTPAVMRPGTIKSVEITNHARGERVVGSGQPHQHNQWRKTK
jgi:hypothetical protein